MDTYMMPATRERNRPFHEQTRLLPEQAALASLEVKKRELSEEFYKQYVTQTIERIENPAFHEEILMCLVLQEIVLLPLIG